MSYIRINSITIENYRSFWEKEHFSFPWVDYKKPLAIVGYNNAGKTNLMNAILYGIGEKFVGINTFLLDDFHNRKIDNIPHIMVDISSSTETKYDWKDAIMEGFHEIIIQTDWPAIEWVKTVSQKRNNTINFQAFGAIRYFNVFYINFHNIKDEINAQRTSWGNLKSFLAKHIKKIVDADVQMTEIKPVYDAMNKSTTDFVIADSKLAIFIESIKRNYAKNLRNNNCEIEFWLPEYEDIFLQMIFKIGLNGNRENMVPVSHFGDWYISMFVMAVIQSIAESSTDDKCLFLFEEPESFLHENHQEYFYKTVLCDLTEKGHQVIYTTHSDRMVDIFDTKGIIRLEFDDISKQTIKKYDFSRRPPSSPVNIETYNDFIRTIEPNLNKILFSKKVILVEWPNDLMAYKYAIESKIMLSWESKRFAETYLNFHNLSIIPHHWKSTALLLIHLCKHFGVDYFVINDWDLPCDFIDELAVFETDSAMKSSTLYKMDADGWERCARDKWIITTNWKLLHEAWRNKIHFNIPKLENVLNWLSDDKDSFDLWELLGTTDRFTDKFFPKSLEDFLEFQKL